jgi:hypothetical protein
VDRKNKRKYFYLSVWPFLIVAFFIFPETINASETDLLITEIMYDPLGSNTGHSKWIEIYNPGNDLMIKTSRYGALYKFSDLYICEMKTEGTCNRRYIYSTESGVSIPQDSFLIIATNPDNFRLDYPGYGGLIHKSSTMSLSSGDNNTIGLCHKDDSNCFSIISYSDFYDKKEEGYSLEKMDFSGKDEMDNWQESYVLGGTPGEKSSEKPAPKSYPKELRISELLPDPDGLDQDGECFVPRTNIYEG